MRAGKSARAIPPKRRPLQQNFPDSDPLTLRFNKLNNDSDAKLRSKIPRSNLTSEPRSSIVHPPIASFLDHAMRDHPTRRSRRDTAPACRKHTKEQLEATKPIQLFR